MEDILSSSCEGRAKFLSWFLRVGASKYTLKKKKLQECFTLEGIERQSTEWSRTLTMHLSDKELDRIYKEHLQLNKKRSNNPMRKWASDINRLYQPCFSCFDIWGLADPGGMAPPRGPILRDSKCQKALFSYGNYIQSSHP